MSDDDLGMLSPRKRALLDGILSGSGAYSRAAREKIPPRPPGDRLPLSAEQRHVWFHAAMAPDLPLYNESITIHRFGAFSIEALEQALNEIIRRHEIWRTSFETGDQGPTAIVHPTLHVKLDVVDLSELDVDARDRQAIDIATADARTPFDMAKVPLLRAKVVRLSPTDHRLYLTLHHIIFDGVVIYRIFLPELSALYDDYVAGKPPSLPPPALQYGDYVLWRARQVEDARARGRAYWQKQLGRPLPQLALSSARKPPADRRFAGSMEVFALSPELTAALKQLSRWEGTTLYMTLLAAFKALLHRYTAQTDIIIGGVTDMRRRPELESVMGYFLNTIPLRTRPESTKRFCDYLHEVERVVVEALDASDFPFDELIRELRIKREPGRHPLFQVLFSMEPPRPAFAPGWAITQMDVTVGTAKFDLYLELDEDDDRIIGRFLYSTELFEASTVRRMIGHWTSLLDGITRDRTLSLAALPLLTFDEGRQQARRNATFRPYNDTRVDILFARQVGQTPDAVAVECDGEPWTYAELDRHAAAIAAQLSLRGVCPGDLVAVAMERSCAMVAGLLAVMRIGAAYLPLDPTLPEQRLRFLLDDAQPAVILADERTNESFPRVAPPRLICRSQENGPAGITAPNTDRPGAPDDLAYVLYTSGSTAKPKPVAIRHAALTNILLAVKDAIALTAADRFLAVTTISFDIAALELFMPLITGGRVVVARRPDTIDPLRLARLIDSAQASIMQATPALWRGLVTAGWSGRSELKILCGGDVLSADLADALCARSAGLWNMYGPTETTIWSLIHRVVPGEDPVPIGRPLANTRLYIVDENDQPVPDRVAGELLIAGKGLAQGYRNEPLLTQKKFVALAAFPGERLYRTGDIARYRADGIVEYLGRIDNQVKIRGFRVGLEEVETALSLHPRIAACAVTVAQDASGESSLAAFVVIDRLEANDIAELRHFLGEAVPDYMIPARFERIVSLPLTANGKVDRKSLPLMQVAQPSSSVARPRDDIERRLTEIWQDTLGIADVGVHDDFFDLGGHSLLAALLAGRIGEAFGRALPLSMIFQSPTIAAIAAKLRSAARPAFSHVVPLKPTGKGTPLFIVHGIFGNVLQLRRLAERLETDRPIYALQARGADPDQQPHATLADMVDAYEAAIREIQPHGPYALGGYSFGGLVAYELARRLRARGAQIGFLGLFETDLYARYLPLKDKLSYFASLSRRVLAKVQSMPPGEIPSYLTSKIAQFGHRLLLRTGLRDDFVDLGDIPGPMATRNREMYSIGARAFVAFNPKPYDGTLTLFRVAGPRFGVCDPLPIWRRAAAAVEIFDIEGSHGTIMEWPHVGDLARKLSERLARLDEPLARLPQSAPTQPVSTVDSYGLVTRLDVIGG